MTSQGLIRTLHDRDGKVSTIFVDEFQGFIEKLYKASYTAGTKDTITELFNGSVPKVLRSKAEDSYTKNSKTVFNMVGIGIADQIAQHLTLDDIASGFVPRFTVNFGHSVEWTPEYSVIPQKSIEAYYEPETTDYGSWFSEVLVLMETNKNRLKHPDNAPIFGGKTFFETNKPVPIFMETEAKKRFDVFAIRLGRTASSSHLSKWILPTAERLTMQTWVCAGLLAIHECKSVISLRHVVKAIEQAEWWFTDLLRFISMIKSTDLEKSLDSVEEWIRDKNGVAEAPQIYRHFVGEKTKTEVDQLLDNLRAQGRIIRMKDNKTYKVVEV